MAKETKSPEERLDELQAALAEATAPDKKITDLENAIAEVQIELREKAELEKAEQLASALNEQKFNKSQLKKALRDGADSLEGLVKSWVAVQEAYETTRAFEGEKKREGLVHADDQSFRVPYTKPQNFADYFQKLLHASVDPGRVGVFGEPIWIREATGDRSYLQSDAQ